jgi:hypothetical protein
MRRRPPVRMSHQKVGISRCQRGARSRANNLRSPPRSLELRGSDCISCIALQAVAAVSRRRHSWGYANPTAYGDNTRPVFGSTDRDGGRAFGCSKGQSRTGQPSLATAPFIAYGAAAPTHFVAPAPRQVTGRPAPLRASCSRHRRCGDEIELRLVQRFALESLEQDPAELHEIGLSG